MVPECRSQTPANLERHIAAAMAPGKRRRYTKEQSVEVSWTSNSTDSRPKFRLRPSLPLSIRTRACKPQSAPCPRANLNWVRTSISHRVFMRREIPVKPKSITALGLMCATRSNKNDKKKKKLAVSSISRLCQLVMYLI